MARSKAYLFGGVEIRWHANLTCIAEKDETPAEAVFHFPGGLRDYPCGAAQDRAPSC
jgi:topoisomerase-4 subunit B